MKQGLSPAQVLKVIMLLLLFPVWAFAQPTKESLPDQAYGPGKHYGAKITVPTGTNRLEHTMQLSGHQDPTACVSRVLEATADGSTWESLGESVICGAAKNKDGKGTLNQTTGITTFWPTEKYTKYTSVRTRLDIPPGKSARTQTSIKMSEVK